MNKGKFVLHQSKDKKSNNVYTYYSIAWYYRNDKKPYRDILKRLGKLSIKEIAYYQRCIDCLNLKPEAEPCNINDVEPLESYEYLSCAIGLHFWDYWQLSSVFNINSSKKDIQTCDVAKILTAIRLSKVASKSLTAEYYKETCLSLLTGIPPESFNKSRIFRELGLIEDLREKLGKHIFSTAKKKNKTKGEVLFYDLSSGNLSGLKCVMAKWGHCKDGYRTHVVLLLVVTSEGYPIYWDILEGNTADSKTIEDLITKIEGLYGTIDSVLCFDRGMVSDDNLKLLEAKGIKFISALDGNQIKHFKAHINFKLFQRIKNFDVINQADDITEAFKQKGFDTKEKNLFYKELKLSKAQEMKIEEKTLKLNLKKRRYFLAFNPEQAFLAQKHRKERVVDFKDWVVNEYNVELSQVLKSKNIKTVEKTIKEKLRKNKITDVMISYALIKYKTTNQNEAGEIKHVTTYNVELDEIKEESYEEAKKYDGIWTLITNISGKEDKNFFKQTSFSSYFNIYRLKNNIEESFKIISDVVEVEPFNVYREKHIKAHFTICVLSYLVDITILNMIRNSSSVENMSLHSIFDHTKKCKQEMIQLSQDRVVFRLMRPTETQKVILNALECSYLIKPKYLTNNKIISA